MITPDSIFVDTSGWLAYINQGDPFNEAAMLCLDVEIQRKHAFVTTNCITSELMALLTVRLHLPRQQLIQAIDLLKANPFLELIYVEKAIDDAAWDLLRQRLDKEWSHVDAISFVVMQRFGLTAALTTDHHFEQAGFVRLLV